MEVEEIPVCRLCLKICKSDFEMIENTVQEMLNNLQLNLDLGISKDPVVCNSCIESLQEYFNFKTDCSKKENHVKSFVSAEDIILKVINECLNEKTSIESKSGGGLCCFCMRMVNSEVIFLVNVGINLTMMLEKHFPQLVLNITDDSATCSSCYKLLQNHFTFTRNCLSVEENIKKFCKFERINRKCQIKLKNVLQFMQKTECENNLSIINNIKTEKCDQTEMDIKIEIKYENLIEPEEQYHIKMEDCDVKTEPEYCDRLEHGTHSPEQPKDNSQKHMLTHNSMSAVVTHECEACPYLTKKKYMLRRHMLVHKNPAEVTMYKCHKCSFETKRKKNLQAHALTHKSTSNVTVYKCETCDYQTKRKLCLISHVRQHTVTHKSNSEILTNKCEMCDYQSKHKNSVLAHMVLHKSDSEVTFFKCERCPFQTKHRRSLHQHMVTHKSTAETTMYKCHTCEFQSKYKKNLRAHILRYKNWCKEEMRGGSK